MEMTEFVVAVEFFRSEPDELNRTTVRVNGEVVWPGEFNPDDLRYDDDVEIRVPSGTLRFRVNSGHTEGQTTYIVGCPAYWTGSWGGLSGGLCACASWRVTTNGPIKTSVADDLTSVDDYRAVRAMVGDLFYGHPEANLQAMRMTWETYKSLKQDMVALLEAM